MRLLVTACALVLLLTALGCRTVDKSLAPSNIRDWEPLYATLPTIEKRGDVIDLRNVRYCKYLDDQSYIVDYYDKQIDLRKIHAVDFLVMPFPGFASLAHTLISFEIVDPPRKPQYLAVSVETRKERGEEFNPLTGAGLGYEITYVVADERDVIQSQVMARKQPVYLYRSTATPEMSQQMFVDIMGRVNELAAHPEWYNTITNNCTTNIIQHINRIKPNRVTYDYRVLLPGLSDQLAYDQNLIVHRGTFEQTKAAALVNDRVAKYAGHEDFSQLIRR